ncbi:hypothetical protein RYX36_021615 [Vicia faba]
MRVLTGHHISEDCAMPPVHPYLGGSTAKLTAIFIESMALYKWSSSGSGILCCATQCYAPAEQPTAGWKWEGLDPLGERHKVLRNGRRIGNERRSGGTCGTIYWITPVRHEAADTELAPMPLAMPCLVPRHSGVPVARHEHRAKGRLSNSNEPPYLTTT